MMTNLKKALLYIGIGEFIALLGAIFSLATFLNIQIAFISSLLIIMGSSYAYKKMVDKKIEADDIDEKRDLLDTIDDPHELYDEQEINDAPIEELDIKAIVKEEKSKIKTFSFSSIKHGAKGSTSLFRLLPYLFLVLGFIALSNNGVLEIGVYLPSLLLGIIVGSLSVKELFS